MAHKPIAADTKLLIDIAPYLNAHGHGLSNFEYTYTYWLAHYNISGDKNALALSEFGERILRSFLVTKNLSYTIRLVEGAIGKQSDLPGPKKNVKYDDIKTEWAKWRPSIISNEIERSKVSKKEIDIAFERYELAWAESHPRFMAAIEKVYRGASKAIASVKFSETMTLIAIIHRNNKDTGFSLSLWREDVSGKTIGSGWVTKPGEGLATWPEIGEAEWKIAEMAP